MTIKNNKSLICVSIVFNIKNKIKIDQNYYFLINKHFSLFK